MKKIQTGWLVRLSKKMARGEGVRESFRSQLQLFFDGLIGAVESGDPAWLDSVLGDWVEARLQFDTDQQGRLLTQVITQIMIHTQEYIRETLPPVQALELTTVLLPIFSYAFEQTAQKEMVLQIESVSSELETAQQELKKLDESKSNFISVAAHELKTPLTLLEGYSSMLRSLFPEDDQSSRAILLLKGIDNGTRRLRQIVDDMIDVSLIDNELMSLNFQPVWINRLLSALQEELRSSYEDRRQKLIIRPFPGSDEWTFADPERVYQALKNILSNSIKYTPDGGKITVDGRKLPGFIEIMISDTGIGINPEDQEHIFEKFGQLGEVSLHSSGKTKFKGGGPGLGLPIARGIIETHGGTIWVESDGCDEVRCPGSTFHVMLPIQKKPPDDRTAKLFQPLTDIHQGLV